MMNLMLTMIMKRLLEKKNSEYASGRDDGLAEGKTLGLAEGKSLGLSEGANREKISYSKNNASRKRIFR